MDTLQDYRKQIDRIDQEMQRLYLERMRIVSAVAALKKAHGLPIYDADREAEMIRGHLTNIIGSPFTASYERFLRFMNESKQYQAELDSGGQ